jgi:hypothetical protein
MQKQLFFAPQHSCRVQFDLFGISDFGFRVWRFKCAAQLGGWRSNYDKAKRAHTRSLGILTSWPEAIGVRIILQGKTGAVGIATGFGLFLRLSRIFEDHGGRRHGVVSPLAGRLAGPPLLGRICGRTSHLTRVSMSIGCDGGFDSDGWNDVVVAGLAFIPAALANP